MWGKYFVKTYYFIIIVGFSILQIMLITYVTLVSMRNGEV